jgi:folate-dependent phosphoribosylglycinamide formyltransferase PurN
MRHLIYDPAKSGSKMTIVFFISGSGTNYREVVKRDPEHTYLVFTNRPDCGGVTVAKQFNHDVIVLSHVPYLKDVRKKYGAGNVPRNCPERVSFEQDAVKLIETKLGRIPDLVCMAGYDQWTTDWLVDKYFMHMLNVHPGDTTKGYDGLHWIPSAKAILAGDDSIRSTLFLVDKGEDTGPIMLQSAPLNIMSALQQEEILNEKGLLDILNRIKQFGKQNRVNSYSTFAEIASPDLAAGMERICRKLQDELKVFGDWKIYPYAVHDLIAKGRVAIETRKIFIDGRGMPPYGMRLG